MMTHPPPLRRGLDEQYTSSLSCSIIVRSPEPKAYRQNTSFMGSENLLVRLFGPAFYWAAGRVPNSASRSSQFAARCSVP
jgi:hypothetical protein